MHPETVSLARHAAACCAVAAFAVFAVGSGKKSDPAPATVDAGTASAPASTSSAPGKDAPPKEAKELTYEDFCQRAVAAPDEWEKRCKPEEIEWKGEGHDIPVLAVFSANRLSDIGGCEKEIKAKLASGRLKYDGVAAAKCVKAARAHRAEWPVAHWDDPSHAPYSLNECAHVLAGQQAEGKPCESSGDCSEGLTCHRTYEDVTANKEGACRKPGAIGAACTVQSSSHRFAGNHPECVVGGECLKTCRKAKNPKVECAWDSDCPDGKRCVGGQCGHAPRVAEGGVCKADAPFDCGLGLTCKRATADVDGKCAALQPTGAACTSPDECKGTCRKAKKTDDKGTCAPFCGSG